MPPSPPDAGPVVATEEACCAVCGTRDAREVGRTRDFEYATCANEFVYVACAGCGLVYLRNRPVPEALDTLYPPHYGNYEAGRSAALTFRVKRWMDTRAVRALARKTSAVRRVLDVGCADGRLLDVCREALPRAALAGLEISEAAARGARARGYDVRIGSVDVAELPEADLDLVFLQQVIEHVYAPDRVVAKLARALAPGGLAVIETPTTDALDFRLFRRRYWGGYHAPRHFHLFSAATLGRLCEKAGLEVVETRHAPQPVHWAWTLHHALLERGAPGWSYGWLNLRNPAAMGLFTGVELACGLLTRRMSNLRLVARRPA